MKAKPKYIYLLMLCAVVFVWGCMPIITKELYAYFSPAIQTAFGGIISFTALFIINIPILKQLNKSYFIVAVPTGIFYALACVFQKVGLEYTTPVMFAFLENLSCIVVPILVWIISKARPHVFKFIAAILCLFSVFVLSGGFSGFSSGFGIGEILCGLAGIFYGVNIAFTGMKAKGLNARLYLMIQFFIQAVISLIYALIFEETRFPTSAGIISLYIGIVLISSVGGWIVRTISVVNLDPTLVAVIMPFSAVITSVLSVALGKDVLTLSLIFGAILGVASCIISAFEPKLLPLRRKKKPQLTEDESK